MSRAREIMDRTKWSIAAGVVLVMGVIAMVAIVPPENQHITSVITIVSTGLASLFATLKAEESAKVSKETKDIVDPNVDTEGNNDG